MFKFILSIITSLKKTKPKIIENIDSTEKFSIQFSFDNNSDNIDIIFDIGDTQNLNTTDIVAMSEKYAQLLLTINHGGFKSQIINILKEESKQSNNNNKILMIDNILSFYDILKKEMLKSSSLYNQPIVPPSMAFRSNRLED